LRFAVDRWQTSLTPIIFVKSEREDTAPPLERRVLRFVYRRAGCGGPEGATILDAAKPVARRWPTVDRGQCARAPL